MARWEYRFIWLQRENVYDHDRILQDFVAEVRQAGDDGWEAVGEVTVTYGTNVRVSTLMFKRAVDADASGL